MDKRIMKYDHKNLINIIKDSWKQAEWAWKKIDITGIDHSKIRNVIISGLGGSAISGDLLGNFLRDELKVSLSSNRTYGLPAYAGNDTLFIASSYSGNTEETLAAVKEASDRGCMIIAVTTGGALADFASAHGIQVVGLKEGYQPRYALYNSFFTLLRIFQELQLVPSQDGVATGIIEKLKAWGEKYSALENDALAFAKRMHGRVPVIYSVTGLNDAAGRRFKGQLNENSKLHAWSAEYPEMNHNEIVGWEREKRFFPKYRVINITDPSMNSRISKRFNVINYLIEKQKIDILTIEGNSESFKERLLECVYFCDWVSYYLAILNRKDPGEIEFIRFLKKKMSED